MSNSKEIQFTKEQIEVLGKKLQDYFENELNYSLGQFEAQFLLDFISKEMGACYYNQGLRDAELILRSKLEDISDALYEIEKPSSI